MIDPYTPAMATSPSLTGGEKKHWWLSNRKIVYKYVKDARVLIATQQQSEIASALNLLDAALALSPRLEHAIELKARSLLYLRRFKDVADMLHDYIPSLKMAAEEAALSDNSSQHLSRERVKLLSNNSSSGESVDIENSPFKCFSVSDLRKKVMAGIRKNCDKDGQWRYLVLGQACCHLGLMEDAMALLQTGKRLASAAFRRESICWSDDSFSFSQLVMTGEASAVNQPSTPPKTESESISLLLGHIKLLLRRKTAALAALDAGLYSEAIRHFSKIVDGRRGAPQGFLAECYMHRASAYQSAGRIAEAIADCNRTLALDPSCIEALSTRASLFESIRCLPDSLHDLEHLKLLYNTILRDRKLPGPVWKRRNVQYREIPGKLCTLTSKIQELKQRVGSGETGNVDYYALIGLRRGCSRSELERAHLLLALRHKPDKANSFIDRCEFADERDLDSVRDRAKMSALLLYRLLQKGYTSVMSTIMDEDRRKAAVALQAAVAATAIQVQQCQEQTKIEAELRSVSVTQPEVCYSKQIENKTPATQSEVCNSKQIENKTSATQSEVRNAKRIENKPSATQSEVRNAKRVENKPSATQSEVRNAKRVENKASATQSEVRNARRVENKTPATQSEVLNSKRNENKPSTATDTSSPVYQGVFCRDLAVVGNLLSQVGFNRPITVKYEALSC